MTPWAECESDEKRLDVHNGLLLSALWDAAFDAGLVSFADDGTAIGSPHLTSDSSSALSLSNTPKLTGLTGAHRQTWLGIARGAGSETTPQHRAPARSGRDPAGQEGPIATNQTKFLL